MIRYALHCTKGHDFEGWFASSQAFERQASSGKLACPQCGATKINKQLMAPGLANARHGDTSTTMVKSDPRNLALRQALREVRNHILANTEDVGPRFAEEARRIHYEEAEHRSIRGETTLGEAEALIEEGIDIAPLPNLPEDLS